MEIVSKIKEVVYKLQGAGTDNEVESWIIFYKKHTDIPPEIVYEKPPEIVYTDPSLPVKVDMSNVDLSTMSAEQLLELKDLLGL